MTDNPERIECDVLIIGCGIAGATAALRLADMGKEVILILNPDTLPLL